MIVVDRNIAIADIIILLADVGNGTFILTALRTQYRSSLLLVFLYCSVFVQFFLITEEQML